MAPPNQALKGETAMSSIVSAQDNIDIIRKLWDALQHPGPDSLQTMIDLMDEDIEWEVVPQGIRRRGRDELRQLIQTGWDNAPADGWHEIRNIFATEDWVCLEYTARGTVTKKLTHLEFEHAPKGHKMELPIVDVFQIKQGKVVRAREYYDQATLMRQLGAGFHAEH
jgi:ketosteroid isomerase-like protein